MAGNEAGILVYCPVHITRSRGKPEFAFSQVSVFISGHSGTLRLRPTELPIYGQNIPTPRPILHKDTVYCPPDGCALFSDEGKVVQVNFMQCNFGVTFC